MPSKAIEIQPNFRKGYLTFVKELPRQKALGQTIRMVSVQCDCGIRKIMRLSNFMLQNTYSCGCEAHNLRKYNPFNPKEVEAMYIKTRDERKQQTAKELLDEIKSLEYIAIHGNLSKYQYDLTITQMFGKTKDLNDLIYIK